MKKRLSWCSLSPSEGCRLGPNGFGYSSIVDSAALARQSFVAVVSDMASSGCSLAANSLGIHSPNGYQIELCL